MSGRGLMYCPDGCAITPLPPCQQINGLVLSIRFVCFFSFFNSFPWILCVLCFFPFQRVPIPPMDVTQNPPPVILRGPRRKKRLPRRCAISSSSTGVERSPVGTVSSRSYSPLNGKKAHVHPASTLAGCSPYIRIVVAVNANANDDCVYDSPNNLL